MTLALSRNTYNNNLQSSPLVHKMHGTGPIFVIIAVILITYKIHRLRGAFGIKISIL